MNKTYKLFSGGGVLRYNKDGGTTYIPEGGYGWDEYLRDVEAGATVLPADPDPEPTPEQLLSTIDANMVQFIKELFDAINASQEEFENATTILGLKKVFREIFYGREE